MRRTHHFLIIAATLIAAGAGSVSTATAAPPTCETLAPKGVRTDAAVSVVPRCGPLGGMGQGYYRPDPFTITDAPDHGSVRISQYSGTTIRYLPSLGYAGGDAFSYTVTTADGTSEPVTQVLTVAPDTNAVPTCSPSAPLFVRPGASREISLPCSDSDGDPLTIEILSGPAHAQLVLGATTPWGRVGTVTADSGYTGADGITFRAGDGRAMSLPASVELTMIGPAVNTPPACGSFGPYGTVVQDTAAFINASCYDADGDDFAVDIVSPAAHGVAKGSPLGPSSPTLGGGRAVEYVPASGYTGPDTFSIRVRDTQGTTSQSYRVSITVSPSPQQMAPVCWEPPVMNMRAGTSRRVGGSCIFASPGAPEVVTPPAHGALTRVDGWFQYTPAAGYTGPDSFSYRILSAGGVGPTQTLRLSVIAGFNDPPQCFVSLPGRSALWPEEAVVRVGEEAEVRASCTDADGDRVAVEMRDPQHGSLLGIEPIVALESWERGGTRAIYRPATGFAGFDQVPATGDDGHGGEVATSVPLTVRAASFNTAPSCSTGPSSSAILVAGGESEYEETCRDGEGDAMSVDIVEPSAGLSFSPFVATGSSLAATVRAAPGFTGNATFVLNFLDDKGGRTGRYGRSIRVIPDPGDVDEELGRGESVGAQSDELPTPTRPGAVRLTTLNEGRAAITTRSGSAPDGYAAFGLTFDITAPDAIPEVPLRLRFRFDGSLLPAGGNIGTITVFRNGVPVADCAGDGATPNPCVASRTALRGGDIEIVVLTVRASTWSFGRAAAVVGTDPPGPDTPPGSAPDVAVQPGAAAPTGVAGANGTVVQGGATVAAPLAKPPVLRLGATARLGAALSRGLRFTVTSGTAGKARARVTIDGRTAKKLGLSRGRAVTVAAGAASARAGKPTAVTARFTKAARRALARAKSVRMIAVVTVDGGTPATKTVTLRR